MNPMHPPRPETDAPRWAGLPVTCHACKRGGVPVMTEDGWRLPLHLANHDDTRNCPGSLAAVEVAS